MRDDATAERVCLARLRRDPTDLPSLLDLGAIALRSGRRDAARTLLGQAVRQHPDALGARVTLGNMAVEDGAAEDAQRHYDGALTREPRCAEAAQGMARALTLLGEAAAAEPFWAAGFAGRAVLPRRYRGAGPGPTAEVLYLAAGRGGNVRFWPWLDDRRFAVTTLYADFVDPRQPLPPHHWVVNAIGDADRGAFALAQAERLLARTPRPIINHPAAVRETGRLNLPALCEGIDGLVAPRIRRMRRGDVSCAADLTFPLLIRAPGFHTGQHLLRVESRDDVPAALAAMPGDDVFAIEALDARGPDGMARKYRVMFIGGRLFPWHLAISPDWKVHYFTAAMAERPAYREEERHFLDDMERSLGAQAVAALTRLCHRMGLDYAGVDFGRAPDGRLLMFEANAAMGIQVPPPGSVWNYRRPAVAAVEAAVIALLAGPALQPMRSGVRL